MRSYARIEPSFWIGETGRALRGNQEAQIVAAYLLSNPHANMLGLYYLPLAFIAHESGLSLEGAKKGLARACEVNFCAYSADSEMVWVYEMARFQVGERLTPTDNRVKGVQTEYDSLPKNHFLPDFFDKYSSALCMSNRRDFDLKNASPLEAPAKPLPSQDQEGEQAQLKKYCTPADAVMPIIVPAVAPKNAPLQPDLDLADLGLWVSRLAKAWPKSQPDGAAVPYTAPSRIKTAMVKACKRHMATPMELAECALGYEQAMQKLPKGGPYRVAAGTFLNSMAGDFLHGARVTIAALETDPATEGDSDAT